MLNLFRVKALQTTKRGRAIWLSAMLVMTAVLPISAREVLPPPRERAEQLTYDPVQDRWVRAPDPVPGTEDGDLDIARQWLAREDCAMTRRVVKDWIDTYGPMAARYPEALYLLGTAEMLCGDYRAARQAYEELLDDFPGAAHAEDALEGRFRVAEQYLAGKRRKALGGLLRIRDREGGLKIMDDIIVNYPDTPLAEKAHLTKADHYFERREFELAEDEYARFANNFPRSRYHAKALLWSAYAALASFPGIEFDDTPLMTAQERFRTFLGTYPDQARQFDVPILLEQIAHTRADKTISIARYYERAGQVPAAVYYYRATIVRWPAAPAASEARARLRELSELVPGEEEAVTRGRETEDGRLVADAGRISSNP